MPDMQLFAMLPMWLAAFLFSLTCHEASHALAAKLGGDDTAYRGGQVTLDPIPHIKRHPFGTLFVPIISFFLNGGTWMLGWGSAPYDPLWATRHPKRAAAMAAAGPAANFAIVLAVAAAIHAGRIAGVFEAPLTADTTHIVVAAGGGESVLTMSLSILFSLNVLLGTFNLLPVPPLDGHGVVGLFLSDRATQKWNELFSEGGFAMIGLLAAWMIYGELWGPIFTFALNVLYPGSVYG